MCFILQYFWLCFDKYYCNSFLFAFYFRKPYLCTVFIGAGIWWGILMLKRNLRYGCVSNVWNCIIRSVLCIFMCSLHGSFIIHGRIYHSNLSIVFWTKIVEWDLIFYNKRKQFSSHKKHFWYVNYAHLPVLVSNTKDN